MTARPYTKGSTLERRSLYLDDETWEILEALGARVGQSRSAWVRDMAQRSKRVLERDETEPAVRRRP